MRKQRRYVASLLSAVMILSTPLQALAVGEWQQDQGKWYHVTENQYDTGWFSEGQDVWYFLDHNGEMKTGWYQEETGGWYYLNRPGEGVEGQMRYGWYRDEQGAWYFLNTEHNGSFGKALTGWIWVDGYCYYFGEDCRMYSDRETPDGYLVDADGRWIVDGIVQREEGKGYRSEHTHETAKKYSYRSSGSGSSGGSGGSGSSGGNGGSTGNSGSDKKEGIYEEANKKSYDTFENVKAFNNKTQEGKEEIAALADSTLDIWVSDLPEASEEEMAGGELQEIQLLVANENPLYQYILEGKIEEGDVIHIPATDEQPMPLTFVYQGHDDNYDGDEIFDPETSEVIHTEEATLRHMLTDEIQYAAGGVNAEDPLAFSWEFQYPGTGEEDEVPANSTKTAPVSYKTATDSNAEAMIATPSNAEVVIATSSNASETGNGAAPLSLAKKASRAGEESQSRQKFKVSFTNDKKTGKLQLKIDTDCILYDHDKNLKTTGDQLKLSGGYEIKDFYPQMALDWPLLNNPGSIFKLDFLPNQIMAKVSCEEKISLGLEYTAGVDCKDVVKAINEANMEHLNKYEVAMFKIQGVDFDKSAVLWAGGITIGTGAVGLNMKDIQKQSISAPICPTFVLMVLLDVDGNIRIKSSAEISKESYRELGVNLQEKGYKGVGGTTEDNRGDENFEVGSHMINVYAKEWRSKTDSRPSDFVVELKAEGDVDLDTSLNVGLGLMLSGLIPVVAKGGVGVDAGFEGSGALIYDHGALNGELDGNVSLELYTKAQILAKIKASVFGAEFGIDLSPEWKWSLYKEELFPSDLSEIRLSTKIKEIYEKKYEELAAEYVKKPVETYMDYGNEHVAFTNDTTIESSSDLSKDSDIWIQYIKPGDADIPYLYDDSYGRRGEEGVYDINCGIDYLFEGIDENTTFGDVLEKTGITGQYFSGNADRTFPAFRFEDAGFRYWIGFESLENGTNYSFSSEEGLNEIDQIVRKTTIKDNKVFVSVDVPISANIDVYKNVIVDEWGAENLESCTVPSGDKWENVIKTTDGSSSTRWQVQERTNSVSFEFQVSPTTSEMGTISVWAGESPEKTQQIHPGTNKITYSWDNAPYWVYISVDGPDTLYIRNAVLNPQ